MTDKFVYRLGGANFSGNYGAFSSELVNRAKLGKILHRSFAVGINRIDWATSYSDANLSLKEQPLDKHSIGTKISISEATQSEDHLHSLLNLQLKQFNVPSFDYVLIHNGDELIFQGNSQLRTLDYRLQTLREKGFTRTLGVSLYDYSLLCDLEKFLGPVSIIQGPLNIFDQRVLHPELAELLSRYRYQARSVFLQGLLLAPESEQSAKFPEFKKLFRTLSEVCEGLNISKLHLCLGFLKNKEFIDEVILGIDSLSQLDKLVSFEQSFQTETMRDLNFDQFRSTSQKLIYPPSWKI